MPGPLEGVKVIELAGLGPAPFCGMVLADLGAEVVRIDRSTPGRMGFLPDPAHDVHGRGKKSLIVDLKHEDGPGIVLDLVATSDALIEGFRPGVAEKLGVGPAECLAAHPSLVYGRMTGWGQDGPYARAAGHDIDYIAVSGLLHAIGPEDEPVVPLNMIGDFGGGGMLLALGVVAGLVQARATGVGQVVDAAMVDGAALLSASIHGMLDGGLWEDRRGSNVLDGAAPFYTTYMTSDSKHMAVGALEPQFFTALLEGLDVAWDAAQYDRRQWPAMRQLFADTFAGRTQEEWIEIFAGTDGCVAPVRSLLEARSDPHNEERGVFIDVGGVTQPAPAPRFSSTPTAMPSSPVAPGEQTDEVLASLGYSEERIGKLRGDGAVA